MLEWNRRKGVVILQIGKWVNQHIDRLIWFTVKNETYAIFSHGSRFFLGGLMDTFTLLLTAVSLAMDASAVSLAKGMALPKKSLVKYAFILAFAFGLFQSIMPCIGYFAGSQFAVFISNIDHWIAFVLLGIIGINMIKEGREQEEECEILHSIPLKTVLLLGIATSIDALAIGVSFAFLQVPILWAAAWIGIITFVLSFCCVLLGKKLGSIFQKYAEYLGGCMLIFLGFKILIEHLFF